MFRSIIFKNIVLFVLILLVAVVPLALRYYQDSRDYEIQTLASKLEFFAQRGASWLDVQAITTLTRSEHKDTPAYRDVLATLNRIKDEFGVDNAIILRRQENGKFVFVAAGHGGFDIGQPAFIHDWFPATYKAANDTWLHGEMMHSQLFGGTHDGEEYAQFLQINTPLKLGDQVVALLMLNKFADPVAAAVRAKTLRVVALSVGIVALGLVLFGFISAAMLRPLKVLTGAAGEVAQGNLDVTVPATRSGDEVGKLARTFSAMIDGLRQRDFIRDTFGRYLSKEVVETLLESPDGLKLGGEMREITLLVSDLRGFTSLAAHLSPDEVINILNRYLERMVEILTRYGATVDEFQGDGILAFFGAPLAGSDDAERGVACAVEMQRAMVDVNEEQRRLGLPELDMGIGINTGQVVVGNIGSEKRTKYGAVGSEINMAYRIESHTVGGQILISPTTYERVQALVRVRGARDVEFKGMDHAVTIYDIGGIGGKYQLALPEAVPVEYATLDPALPIACYAVEGKTVSDTAIPGYIMRLAGPAAEARLERPVGLNANLKIALAPQDTTGGAEAYAKVVAIDPRPASPPETTVSLRFTSLPDAARSFLERRRAVLARSG